MPAFGEQLGHARRFPRSSANTVWKRRETWALQLSQWGMSLV